MAALSDKLKSLGVKVGARDLPKAPPRLPEAHAIEQVVSGDFEPTPYGPVFVTEQYFEASYRHGRIGLQTETTLRTIADWAQEPALSTHHLDQFAFLDTETSGLAGGTGTYTFLIGVGRFEGEQFRLAQFFMRDPGEERAQLAALTKFLEPCRVLVTFNGKSFDAPLVNTRYTVNGLESPLPALAHLDLLPLARRLWRDRLPSRALGELEKHILGAERSGEDVPGWLIPSLYFDYLRGGDARPLKGVFYHNALDVLAMAGLLNHMSQMLADPISEAVEHALDLVAIAKLHEALGNFKRAVQLFEAGMARSDLSEEHYWETQRRLSFLHKRHKNFDAAVEIWQLACDGRRIYAHVELAKFYEHKQRDYLEASRWTQAALDLLALPNTSSHKRREWVADLKYRLARLQRKLNRAGNA